MDRYLEMASSSNQAGEFERMMAIVDQMMRSWDNDVSVEKVVDRVVEIEGQFDGRNITKFLDAYKKEMNLRDVSKARQITSFQESCCEKHPKKGHRASRREDNMVQVRESDISGVCDGRFVEDDSTCLYEVDRKEQ